ncbi:bifunctional (p)ppGpp synthetase/guanosine-3',5'-bis(diphosphate) 3'-pyrophosphohydrolase [Hyphobacterium sp. CCMP332]|uniref:RelA/SpoT family protein n=1 Tax=Hyphobacterium sp. CCMP332 TaxID=2749086 RepID=UPI00164F6B82|nr:bifunctional (p)ppGpp synthetase/guanosine-3',5'-bis(diphosphate) 3'-pyrophosphohydrolase [Hyphobacterium sp. CCMP332]QNL18818.1 bifunctional (p)ppGpp synthetase/guanosine-3',5'-bis(diphosphate) 3'-pyrophosphohydrolase [Hyphobacterium sp. CCMP332]
MSLAAPDLDHPAFESYPTADDLVGRISKYYPTVDADLIHRAYDFAREMHAPQKRYSGEPYFAHVASVAMILADLKMDAATICTGLLHDTVEDTPATLKQLSELFSPEIAALVDGVTKLGQMELGSNRTKQAENFQKLVVAISSDVRVLIVKLCDRLHNMRTLYHVPKPDKRERIATETLEIYAPLARRIGINRLCVELEDLSFRHINPAAFESVSMRLAEMRESRSEAVAEVSQVIMAKLEASGIQGRVFGREKRPYSIWRKLERKGTSFGEIADIYAFRLIVDQVDDCYRALGIIHQNWRCVPERFRDFISTPKPNNYRSLHTTIVGPESVRVEIQIRTEEMDAIAESGVAAHWRYKGQSYGYDADAAKSAGGDPLERLRPFLEILEQGGDPDEFLEHAKLEMFADQVYCFTPKGELIALPSGATPLDFAYAVHTELGHTCIGAKVNGRDRPLRTRLKNGDVVNILRGGLRQPPAGWEELAVTGKARAAIRRLIRTTERAEFEGIGKMLAEHAFEREGKVFREKGLEDALARLDIESTDELYQALGRGRLTSGHFLDAVFPGRRDSRQYDASEKELIRDDKARLYVRGRGLTPGVSIHFSECCSPLPGDRIVGVMVPDKGVTIHTIDCDSLTEHDEADPDRWIDLGWTAEAEENAVSSARVHAVMHNTPGALAEIARAVGENRGNIGNLKTLKRAKDFFEMQFDIEVFDNRHLANIISALKMCNSVVSAERARGEMDEAGV